MGVLSAEALTAQANAVRNPSRHKPPVLAPRDRKLPPNPAAAGGNKSAPGAMPYFRTLAEPVPLGKRPVKSIPKPVVKAEEGWKEPEGEYSEFVLKSTKPDEWNYSILHFQPANRDRKVDITAFAEPIKMNRKTPKSKLYAEAEFDPSKPMEWVVATGKDGQPIYHNGQPVMQDKATGVFKASWEKQKAAAAAAAKDKGKGKEKQADTPNKKKGPSKPKLRQTFKASEQVRALRREEYHPWVLEDSQPSAAAKQEWIGKMTSQNDKGTYAIMTIAPGAGTAGGFFEFIPLHRFYNFIPKRQHSATMRADDAEKIFSSKTKIDIAKVFAKRNGGEASAATQKTLARMAKMEEREMKPFTKREQADDDDLFGGGRRGNDMDGDMDEMEFEDDVADDDEGDRHEEMAEDEDEKQMKERLKREYISANKAGQGVDDDDDEEFEDMLNADGKRLKNVLKKSGDLDEESDDSDDDDYYGKRYGSQKKEEDEDENMLPVATGVQEQPQRKAKATPPPPGPAAPKPSAQPTAVAKQATDAKPVNEFRTTSTPSVPARPLSRANSPSAPPPGSGAALVALRATSSPKRASAPLSRANSPAGRAMSPLAGDRARATSPSAPVGMAPANAATVNAKKRKEAPSGQSPAPEAAPAAKKVKADIPTAEDLIQFLTENGGKVATKTVAKRFRTKDSGEVKKALVEIVKQVGTMINIDDVQYITLKQ